MQTWRPANPSPSHRRRPPNALLLLLPLRGLCYWVGLQPYSYKGPPNQ
ncbi:hypothetical protein CKAH01_12850 [Colletotrichum kahawae]|uniref:Uncharacterized protein n=1 Tax=Colletotrichum kahawae TaxID=34407 RepID=A0AAD9YU05_COLKA|nr:hypothetical protein CKAH01_12850 [Colletotrichum kahawae]